MSFPLHNLTSRPELSSLAGIVARRGCRYLSSAIARASFLGIAHDAASGYDTITLATPDIQAHWALLANVTVVSGMISDARGVPTDINPRLQRLSAKSDKPTTALPPLQDQVLCDCRYCAPPWLDFATLPGLDIITGLPTPFALREDPNDAGAMRRDLAGVIGTNWPTVHSVPFKQWRAAGHEITKAIRKLYLGRPGILLIVRGGDPTTADLAALREGLEPGLKRIRDDDWTIGAAIGHSSPERTLRIGVDWALRTPSTASDAFVVYHDSLRQRKKIIAALHTAQQDVTACHHVPTATAPDPYLLYQLHATLLEQAEQRLPQPILRTTRLRDMYEACMFEPHAERNARLAAS